MTVGWHLTRKSTKECYKLIWDLDGILRAQQESPIEVILDLIMSLQKCFLRLPRSTQKELKLIALFALESTADNDF